MKQSVAIMDLGTSKITVLVGSRGINNTLCIDGIGVCEYAGYSGGVWLEPDKLSDAICRAVTTAADSARISLDKIYVGVPNDFSACVVSDVSIALNKRRRVTEQDVDVLLESGNKFTSDLDWSVINIQAVYYTLDDDRKLVEPVGLVSSKLGGSISYMLGRNDFKAAVESGLALTSVPEVEYISTSLAEMHYLFDDYRRDRRGVLLADIGALGTALSIGRGDGLCRQYYFPWGGARITVALSDELGIPLAEAEKLKRKAVLSLTPGDYDMPSDGEAQTENAVKSVVIVQDEYEVEINSEVHKYPVENVNNIIYFEIKQLARYISKALKECDYEFPESTPLSITGGGLNCIRSAAEYLSVCLERDVETVAPTQPMLSRPQLSSALGLLDMVLTNDPPATGVFDRFRRWLFKR